MLGGEPLGGVGLVASPVQVVGVGVGNRSVQMDESDRGVIVPLDQLAMGAVEEQEGLVVRPSALGEEGGDEVHEPGRLRGPRRAGLVERPMGCLAVAELEERDGEMGAGAGADVGQSVAVGNGDRRAERVDGSIVLAELVQCQASNPQREGAKIRRRPVRQHDLGTVQHRRRVSMSIRTEADELTALRGFKLGHRAPT
ncbi:MAG: hypothetical protein R2705_21510 [Ilumatobacteraceae bacterium]